MMGIPASLDKAVEYVLSRLEGEPKKHQKLILPCDKCSEEQRDRCMSVSPLKLRTLCKQYGDFLEKNGV